MKVWKLQRPLFASDGAYGDVMAYPEDRSTTAIIPIPIEDVDTLFGDEVKIYVLAEIRDGNLMVAHRVEDEDW